jgi:glycosyltransferase involved in cell wall biosynthesis
VSTEPLVSAITIFLNEGKYLEEALGSIFDQTYDNWELLLVDDGSTDGSMDIAQRYAARYPDRVHYLEHAGHENRGMSVSRNLGIAHARGEFIAFLDADDIWMPKKLTEQVSLFHAYPEAGMVYGRTLIWHSWTNTSEGQNRDHLLDLGVTPDHLVQPPSLFYVLLQNKAQTPTSCNALLRRSILTNLGGFEESFRGMYEDQALFAKVHLRFPVYVSGQCWAKYRQHPEMCSAEPFNSQNYCAKRLPFLEWLSAYLLDSGTGHDSPLWKAVQKELWLCRHPSYFRFLNRYWHWRRQIAAWLARTPQESKLFWST